MNIIIEEKIIMSDKRQQKALLSVRVTNKFKEDLEKIAEDKGMTLPDFIRYVLTDYKENIK